jgi:Rieske Fe-S protein
MPLASVSAGFVCPCHFATFDITGKNTSIVAPRPLTPLPACSDSTGVHVTLA